MGERIGATATGEASFGGLEKRGTEILPMVPMVSILPMVPVLSSVSMVSMAPITRNAPMSFLQSMIDAVDYGLLALGAHSHRVLMINQEAERSLESQVHLMRISEGEDRRLELSKAQTAQLRLQIELALTGASRLVQIEGQTRGKLTFSISALAGFELAGEPVVLLSFERANSQQRERVATFAQTCGMTRTETDVLQSLIEGHSPKGIASKHFVAESTVRSQIRSIRQKTQCEGIRELLLQISRLPPARRMAGAQAC